MAVSIFEDKSIMPDDNMFAGALGNSKLYYDELLSFIEKEYGLSALEWKFYGKNSGWTQKMLSGKRNILFLIPLKDSFRLAFTFGDKAVDKIMESAAIPSYMKDELDKATKYMEGRGLQVEVCSGNDMEAVLELIKIKMNN